jgi:hypothetical protein
MFYRTLSLAISCGAVSESRWCLDGLYAYCLDYPGHFGTIHGHVRLFWLSRSSVCPDWRHLIRRVGSLILWRLRMSHGEGGLIVIWPVRSFTGVIEFNVTERASGFTGVTWLASRRGRLSHDIYCASYCDAICIPDDHQSGFNGIMFWLSWI